MLPRLMYTYLSSASVMYFALATRGCYSSCMLEESCLYLVSHGLPDDEDKMSE